MRPILLTAVLAALVATALTATAIGTRAEPSCRSEVGARKADAYVRQCLDVSPATHPPCNATNSCALIISEIRRGCGMLTRAEAPAFCAQYRGR
jgi:hypothetical protein